MATGIPVAVLAGALLFGLGEGFFLVVYLVLQANVTPDALIGPITSSSSLLASLALAIGVGWMGLALQLLGGPGAFGFVAAFAVLLAARAFMSLPLRIRV